MMKADVFLYLALFLIAMFGLACAHAAPVYPKVKFTFTADDVDRECAAALEAAEKGLTALAAMPRSERNFANTVAGFERVNNTLDDAVGTILFLKETSPNADVQAAGIRCQDQVSAYYVKTYARQELWAALKDAVRDNPRLDPEDAKLLEELLRSFHRSGASLPKERRVAYEKLRAELALLENQFQANLARANDTVELTGEELEGLPEDFVSGLDKTDRGTHLLTLLNASAYIPFLENAKNAAARKKVTTAHEKVAAAVNVPLLEKAIALRHQAAQILGFKNHAEFVLDAKMAKSPSRVLDFLSDLATRLAPKAESDLAELLELKRRDEPGATTIEMWDRLYYANQLKKERYSVDGELIREYFPVDHVIESVFGIYEKLLGVSYREIKPAYAWAPDVRLFEVRNKEGGALMGHFYADLYPRENKYKHFAAFTIGQARREAEGGYHTPVSAMVGNWPKPTGDKPALLTHDDVETFFHEFGHIMHQVLTTARYSFLAGTNVRGDYVEAPSQMLENWAWEKEMLRKISKHYRTGEALPEALIDKMVAAKHAGEGLFWSRQLFFATVDMTYHTAGETVDTTAVWRELQPRVMRIRPPEGAQPQASFGHLMGGYDAGYYGYLWSKVFAEDMYTVFQRQGLEDALAGGRYRNWILAPGATMEPDVLIREFLGREPSKEAFYQSLGIAGASTPRTP